MKKQTNKQTSKHTNHFDQSLQVWNDTLAKLAEMNAKTCVFGHDDCRNTGKNSRESKNFLLLLFLDVFFSENFLYAGQNIGQISSKTKHLEPTVVIKKIIEGWFNEHKDADMSYCNNFRHHPNGLKIGHFTQLVRDEAFAMGCAMTQFVQDLKYTTIFTCDYTLSNIDDYPIYESSDEVASGCKTSINEKYPGLCSVKEIYDNDLFYYFF